MLLEKFEKEYGEYTKKTRRMIPCICQTAYLRVHNRDFNVVSEFSAGG